MPNSIFTLLYRSFLLLFISSVLPPESFAADNTEPTRVIILGTGTPVPDATRTGPGVAIITNGEAYVFDAGGGMVKRATQANQIHDIPELYPQDNQVSVYYSPA